MKWASTLSTATRLETAVREAALGIKEKLEGAAPDFAALFVAQAFAERREDIQNLLAKHLPARVLVGASAAGVIGGGREWESKAGLSLVAAVLPDVKLRTFAIRDEDLPDLDDSPRAWESLVGVRAAEEPQFVVLADPFSIRLDNFLSGLDYAFPKSVKVGGVASGASEPGRGALYLNDQCLRGGLVGVSFTGNLRIDSVVAQGCRPIGRPPARHRLQGKRPARGGWKTPGGNPPNDF
jgi:small ligand-binding sensory domain FIST